MNVIDCDRLEHDVVRKPLHTFRHHALRDGPPGPCRVTRPSMSSNVSPLAPANVPDLPAIDGVRLATAQAGIRYKNRTDVLLAVFDKGTSVAGVFTRSKCRVGPGRMVPRARCRRQGARARRQFRQCQCLHRQARPRGGAAHRGARGQGAVMPEADVYPRLDRGDRRAARRREIRRRCWQALADDGRRGTDSATRRARS